MRTTLVRPCANCPFRTDVPGYLRRERARDIADALARGGGFPCHETTVEVEGEDGEDELAAGPDSQFCAGAMIVLEKMGEPNQLMRVSERVGLYKAGRLDLDAPVAGSLIEFVDHHDDRDEAERECCRICGPGCEAPAGYLIGGTVVPAEEGETAECPVCGEHVCAVCSNDEGVCEWCEEVEGDRQRRGEA